jgi:integrase
MEVLMGREIHRLTTKQVAAKIKPGRYGDGGNLYLSIQPSGARRWVFMYRLNGKQREMMLGSADAKVGLSLAKARQLAGDSRAMLAAGQDPIQTRTQLRTIEEKVPTFSAYVDIFLKRKSGNWRNAKSAAQWQMTLVQYCKPIASVPLDRVDVSGVLKCLQPIWTSKAETASRLRGRIEKVLDAAKAEGYRSGENPAVWKGNLETILARRDPLSRKHHGALAYELLQEFLEKLRRRQSIAASALELAILTGARTSEVINATWPEFDLNARVWTIPKTRTKTGKEYRIPLSESSLRLLASQSQLNREGLVFMGQALNRPLSNMAMLQLLKRMGYAEITTHGFRSTFRDWGSETTHYPNEVLEMALGHRIRDKAEEAYRRGDLFEKRCRLMDDWAAFCEQQPSANVVQLRPR